MPSEEGFLHSETALVQTVGRATRNVNDKVILYEHRQFNPRFPTRPMVSPGALGAKLSLGVLKDEPSDQRPSLGSGQQVGTGISEAAAQRGGRGGAPKL